MLGIKKQTWAPDSSEVKAMNKEKIKQIKEEQLVSIDNVIFEPMPKRPFPRDKYIYEDEKFNSEQDWIYLNKLGKTIEITSITFIFLSLIGLLAVFVWIKF